MEERRSKILELIVDNGFMSIAKLAELFPNISAMTIRRDLETLEQRGEVVRTKGGAKSIVHLSMHKEATYQSRENENKELKKEIAKKTTVLINENECVYLDSGSTIMYIAKEIQDKAFFVVTSGPNVATELAKNTLCEVSMLGGRLNHENISLSGLGAVNFLRDINIGTAIIAASGYSPEHGFTCGHYDECELKRAVIAKASRKVVVMDSTKYGKSQPFTIATPNDIDVFVTDSLFEKSALGVFRKAGVQIL